MRKRTFVGLIGGFLLILSLSLLFTGVTSNDTSMKQKPYSSASTVLDYGEFIGYWWIAEGNDVISWSFSSSNIYVGITVMAMTDDQYSNFYNDLIYIYYELSDGTYISQSGSFEVPFSDTWYLIFFNNDGSMQTTTLTYSGLITYNYFGGTYIAYNQYGYSYWPSTPLNAGDTIDWAFEGSNHFVGITARAMTDAQFSNFQGGYSYTYYSLSGGSFYIDSGTFTVPSDDYWYIVFLNQDVDQEPTDLVWSATHYAAVATLDITSPISSDSWTVGTYQYIYYDATSVDYVDLYLYQNEFYLSTIVTDLSATTGSYYWYIPSSLYADSNYQIYIQDSSNTLVNDLSEEFTIVNPLTLPYNYYRYNSLTAAGGDSIDWYFTGSNTNVYITVYAMDSEAFYNFQNALPYDYYGLFGGTYYSSSGSFNVPYSDTWYICFMNWDTSQEATNLNEEVVLEENYFGGTMIDFNEYGYSFYPALLYSGNLIEWSFKGTNSLIEITVYAMDSLNYTNFIDGYDFTYYSLSSGETEDDGVFTIPYDGTWYFLFVNLDTIDQKPTDLIWNLTLLEFSDDAFEENDDFEHATPISEGNYTDLAAIDDDWYIIHLLEGDTIVIDLYFSHADGDIDVALVDDSANVVASSQTTTDNEHIEYLIEATGDYFILVYEFTSNPHYDMNIGISTESTTTTTTTTTTETTTESTNTNTSVDTKFGLNNIPGYSLSFLMVAGVFAIIFILSRKKTLQ